MKITHVRTGVVRLPADEPLANGPQAPGATRDFVTLRLGTDAGIEGIGLTFFGEALTGALRAAVDILADLAVGEDPLGIEAVRAKVQAAAASCGPGGIAMLALAALDMALWDIKGKALGLSVCKLAGGHRSAAPAYASGALMRTFPLDHVANAAATLVAKGYTQMKTQLALPGAPDPDREVERIRVIRQAIGPGIALMCDINQRWDAREAVAIGRRLEDFHLFWLEDVVAHDDYPGMASVAAALATPIAGGEYVYGAVPFRHMLEARSVDIVMIDVLRAGGITPWLKIAGMAQAFNLPVVSHLLPEIQVHLIAAIPHGLTLEYMPWSMRLFKDPPLPERGVMAVPGRPGLGLEFDEATLDRYRG
jgi:L-alanine-DL-glutamate epimerase-like enolase superfamily enzyme